MSVKRLSMLLVGVCLVSVRGKYEMFAAVPGNVTVLQGSPLSLIWSMNRAVGDIGWCEWSYRDASSSSVTPFRRFLGFSHTNNFGRDNISDRHSGWQFINDNDGCGGGLIKKDSGSHDAGQYQIVIEMQNSVTDQKVYRDIATVIVVTEADLEYFVAIDNTSYRGSVTNTPALLGDTELKRDQSLALNVSAPYADDVTIYWKTHIKHCGERSCALQVNASESEKTRSQIIFSIGYKIQGVQDLELKLNTTIQGVDDLELKLYTNVQLSEAVSNVNIAAIILGVLFAILIIGVIIAMWMFYKRRKRPHKLRDEEDVRFMPKQPDDNSLSGEPPHDCMEPKLQEEIDRLNMSKKELDDQIVELNSKETRLQEEYENKLRLKQEAHDNSLEQLKNEHQAIIDEKDQLIDRKSGKNKENGQEGNDVENQLEYIKPGQKAEILLDDTHDNRQQWERDRDELLQKVDDIMVIYQNNLKEYGLPQVKEELQQIYGDIAEKMNCIYAKRKQRPHDDEYIKSLYTYQKLAERSLDTFCGLMASSSPQGYQYANLNKIETTFGVIKNCQVQLENMVENTQLDGTDIIRSIQKKLQMWNNQNKHITGDLITYMRGIESKLKFLVSDQDRAITAWKTTTKRYDHFLTDPVDAESDDPSPTRDVSHNYDNQTVSNLGGHNEFPPPDMPGC